MNALREVARKAGTPKAGSFPNFDIEAQAFRSFKIENLVVIYNGKAMEDLTREILIEAGKVLYTRIIFKQWFNEAARASNAIYFIKKKGLWKEYLCER